LRLIPLKEVRVGDKVLTSPSRLCIKREGALLSWDVEFSDLRLDEARCLFDLMAIDESAEFRLLSEDGWEYQGEGLVAEVAYDDYLGSKAKIEGNGPLYQLPRKVGY